MKEQQDSSPALPLDRTLQVYPGRELASAMGRLVSKSPHIILTVDALMTQMCVGTFDMVILTLWLLYQTW